FELAGTNDFGDTIAKELMANNGKRITILGYLVTAKNTGTKDGKLMHFGTFYDSQGEVFDTIHFPDVARKFPFRGRGFYYIRGRVMEDFGVVTIEVERMEKMPFVDKFYHGPSTSPGARHSLA